MTREEKKKEMTKLFLTAGVSFNDILDEAMNFQIDKACEWLERELKNYITVQPYSTSANIDMDALLEDLKKAMKGDLI